MSLLSCPSMSELVVARARAYLCPYVYTQGERTTDVPLSGAGDFQRRRCSERKKGEKSHRPFLIIRFVPILAGINFYDILTGRIPTSVSLITSKGKSFLIVLFLFRWKNSFASKEYDDAINLI